MDEAEEGDEAVILHYSDGQTVDLRRIATSPWARNAIHPVTLQALDDRADQLGVNVSTVKSRGEWTVRARQGPHFVELRAAGPLETIIAGCLDDFEASICEHDRVTSERAYIERPEGEYPMGTVGICDACGAPMRLSGDEDEDGSPAWEIDFSDEELVQVRRQSRA